MSTTLRAVCVIVLTTAGIVPAFAAPPDEAALRRLIVQLGSAHFAERQAATTELQSVGVPALAALRAAALSPDLEIRTRAQELIVQIERRQETERLLASPPVTLTYQATPFPAACQDFEQRTGFTLKLAEEPAVLANRTVTLTATGQRWQLLEQFCTAAGLVETEVRLHDRPQALVRLADGAPAPPPPTCYAGKLRLRALPPEGAGWGQTPGVVQTTGKLEVAAEAGITWYGIPSVRVQRAVDEHGQVLEQAAADDLAAVEHGPRFRRSNIVGYSVTDIFEAPLRLPVALRLAARPSRQLKELTGTLLGQLETPPETVATVDAVLQAANQTVTGKDGSVLRIGEVSRDDDGTVKVAIDYQLAMPDGPAPGARGVNRAWLAKRALGDFRAAAGTLPAVELHDQAGQPYECARYNEISQHNSISFTYAATLHFLPRKAAAEPARLVLFGRRIVVVEVPFTLRDVPLP